MYEELIANIKIKLGLPFDNDDDALLSLYIRDAIALVNDIRNFTPTEDMLFESKFVGVVEDMVVEAYQKRGSEGVSSVAFNGVSQTYQSTTYSQDILSRITPIVRVSR